MTNHNVLLLSNYSTLNFFYEYPVVSCLDEPFLSSQKMDSNPGPPVLEATVLLSLLTKTSFVTAFRSIFTIFNLPAVAFSGTVKTVAPWLRSLVSPSAFYSDDQSLSLNVAYCSL